MKYVMFTHHKTGFRVPVFGSHHLCHDDLRAGKDWIATSAGYFDVTTQKTHGVSTTLQMVPAPGDDRICLYVVGGLESVLMLVQDMEENKRALAKVLKRKPKK